MPVRALLVLLVMLNVGVATWWVLRPAPPAPAPWVQPADVPRLQLLGEEPRAQVAVEARADVAAATLDEAIADQVTLDEATAARAAAAPAVDGIEEAASTALRCSSFGPFSDAASVAAARSVLQPQGAARMRVRDEVQAPRGWRVVMAPLPDRAAADALATKIRDAGFDDLLVVPSGDEANSIALGRYGSESSARRRESALRTAGFPAQAQPLGDAVVSHWLDVAAGPGFDAAAAGAAASAAQVKDIECDSVLVADAAR